MVGRKFQKVGLVGATLFAALAASPAAATVISFDLDTTVEGTTPSGFPMVTFDDGGSTGSVTMTIDASGLSGGEFISALYFNFDGAGSQTLAFARAGGTGPSSGYTISQGADAFDSPGNQGLFDILIDFSTSGSGGGALRLNAGESLIFTITGDGLSAGDFDIDSAEQRGGSNFILARIQGSAGGGSASVADGDGGGGGGEIPVPEPAAVGLFGLGLLGLGLHRRRRIA